MAKEAAETVTLVIDEEGIESLISELLKGVGDSQVCLIGCLLGAYHILYLSLFHSLYICNLYDFRLLLEEVLHI